MRGGERGAATRSVGSRCGRRSDVAEGGARVARGRRGAAVCVRARALLAGVHARWSGGDSARGERGGGEGLGWPAGGKRATIWPPPSPATTRWSWLRSELAGRQRRPKWSRVWRPLPDRPLTPRNTPFLPSDSLGLSPSVSAGLKNGGIPSRKRRGEVWGGRGSQFPPAEPISARRSASTGWIGRRKTLSATPPPSTAL